MPVPLQTVQAYSQLQPHALVSSPQPSTVAAADAQQTTRFPSASLCSRLTRASAAAVVPCDVSDLLAASAASVGLQLSG